VGGFGVVEGRGGAGRGEEEEWRVILGLPEASAP
jgi:hypothetical protein